MQIAHYHGITSMFYPMVKDLSSHVPSDILETMRKRYYSTIAFNLRVENIFWSLKSHFNKYGIPLVPIKGMALLLNIYRSCPSRQMRDLDILINKEDYEKVKLHLAQMNYSNHMTNDEEQYWLNHQMHVHFFQAEPSVAGCFLEVHWRLDYKRKYAVLPKLWNRIRSEHYKDKEVTLLSPEDTLFSLALHQRHYGGLLQLKYVVDVGQLFRSYGKELDQDYILEEAERSKLNSVLFALLAQTAPFYNDDKMTFLMDKLRVGPAKRWLIVVFMQRFQYANAIIRSNKSLFAIFHCFLFDSWIEPIAYTLFIPHEQFCKFYDLGPYAISSRIKYEIRHFYGMYRLIKSFFIRDSTPRHQ
jgi:hypothetical protein